jgi:hypothetical protein
LRKILILLLVLAALGGAGYIYILNRPVAGPLTGEPINRDIANRRPIAVMIDNFSPDARPQSGLDRASIVYEALAEGGITRFLAVFLEHDAPTIGPVRSARPYFNSWAAGLGAMFGHDGGSVAALAELNTLDAIYNVDAHWVNGPFWRSTAREAPHNEYTSTKRIRAYASGHNGDTSGAPASLPHKSDAPSRERPGQFTLTVPFSYGDYNVVWSYDAESNTYRRSMGGVPHVEATTGKELRIKNVVVMYTKRKEEYDPNALGLIGLVTEGSGRAAVYRDGTVVKGEWRKPSIESSLQWLDDQGNPIELNRGNTWVEVVPSDAAVVSS